MADKDETEREKLDALIALFLIALMVPGAALASASIRPDQLVAQALPIIADHHAQAAVLGRTAAGIDHPMDDDDREFGEFEAQHDKPYLERFAGQLSDGWGVPTNSSDLTAEDVATVLGEAIENRLDLYANRLHGSAHEAFVMASPDGSMFDWVLTSDHPCEDCPEIADGSPYSEDTLPSYPGDGDTECGTRCKCYLVRDDGLAPFAE